MNSKDAATAMAAEDVWNQLVDEYKEYIEGHRAALPASLLNLSLHDSKVAGIEILGSPTTLRLKVESKDGPIVITYEDVSLLETSWDHADQVFPGLKVKGFGSWLYDELSVIDPVRFRHEIILDSGLEVSLNFAGARVDRDITSLSSSSA